MTRVRALWHRSRLVIAISWFFFGVNIVTYIVIFVYLYASASFIPAIAPFTGCQFMPTFAYTYVALVASIVFETCIITLTIFKTLPQVRQQFGTSSQWLSPLLFTDGLIYYLAIIAVQISTLVITNVADTSISFPTIISFPGLAVVAISCNRLFIRLQRNLSNKTDSIIGGNTSAGITTEANEIVTFGQGGRRRVRGPLSTGFSSIALAEMGIEETKKDPEGDVSW
jgi:hypothetical protein